jgi:hypothetical protein
VVKAKDAAKYPIMNMRAVKRKNHLHSMLIVLRVRHPGLEKVLVSRIRIFK